MFSKVRFCLIALFLCLGFCSCYPPRISYSMQSPKPMGDSVTIQLLCADAFGTGMNWIPGVNLLVKNQRESSVNLKVLGLNSESVTDSTKGTAYILSDSTALYAIEPKTSEVITVFFRAVTFGDTLLLNYSFDKYGKKNHILKLNLLMDGKLQNIIFIPVGRKKNGLGCK